MSYYIGNHNKKQIYFKNSSTFLTTLSTVKPNFSNKSSHFQLAQKVVIEITSSQYLYNSNHLLASTQIILVFLSKIEFIYSVVCSSNKSKQGILIIFTQIHLSSKTFAELITSSNSLQLANKVISGFSDFLTKYAQFFTQPIIGL